MADLSFVYFGEKYGAETGGEWGYLVDETNMLRVEWGHVIAAIVAGYSVTVRHAEEGEKQTVDQCLATYKECKRLDRLDAIVDQITQ